MKKKDVTTGATYLAKVSGAVVPVRIREEHWVGEKHVGWIGVNTETGRSVRIKSAQRLRRAVGGANGGEAPAALKATKVGPTVGPVAGDVGAGAGTADAGEVVAKAASPVPPDGSSGAKAKRGKKAAGGQKAKAPKAARPVKATKPAKPKKDRPMSCLDAAAKVLGDAKEPMRVNDMIAAMEKKNLWKSKAGKTPAATLYAAIIREVRDKGVDSRFEKKDRGLFAAAGK